MMRKFHSFNTPTHLPQRSYFYLVFALWFVICLSPISGNAQNILVCDAVTHFPIRDVIVHIDNKRIGQTTWEGLIQVPDSFQSAQFDKKGYLSERLLRTEVLKDTVFLFPADHYLDEVIVVGKQIVDGRSLLKKMPKRDILEKRSSGGGAFDLATILDRRYRRDKKHVAQLREVFKKIDGLTDKEDPIIKAYRQTQLELRNDSIEKSKERK